MSPSGLVSRVCKQVERDGAEFDLIVRPTATRDSQPARRSYWAKPGAMDPWLNRHCERPWRERTGDSDGGIPSRGERGPRKTDPNVAVAHPVPLVGLFRTGQYPR